MTAELSEREKQVLKLLSKGMLDKQIAHELGICEFTVKKHNKNIYQKTGLSNRTLVATNFLHLRIQRMQIALERALDTSRGQISDDMYVTKQRLDQTHGFLKNFLLEQDT